VLCLIEDHEGFDGVMLGTPGMPHHFEFTLSRTHPVVPCPFLCVALALSGCGGDSEGASPRTGAAIVTLSTSAMSSLLDRGEAYVDVSTTDFPAGESREQVPQVVR
jgi:hypothetical protein